MQHTVHSYKPLDGVKDGFSECDYLMADIDEEVDEFVKPFP